MRNAVSSCIGAVVILAGCSSLPSVPTIDVFSPNNLDTADLVLIRGFREDGDPCKITAETPFTNQFLDDSATLVSCPIEYPGRVAFSTDTKARQVAQRGDYVLYSVPRS
ncbi:MAG: hypothetical protein ABJO67_20880 [Pseudoruegeria sp.]